MRVLRVRFRTSDNHPQSLSRAIERVARSRRKQQRGDPPSPTFPRAGTTLAQRRKIARMSAQQRGGARPVVRFSLAEIQRAAKAAAAQQRALGGDEADAAEAADEAARAEARAQRFSKQPQRQQQGIRKKYMRLAANSDTSVRPHSVLRLALDAVMHDLAHAGDYAAACDELKSIRQDITVQHLRDPFTVTVYEFHGRLALEHDDLGEFNQCQNQLVDLYANPELGGHPHEFAAYRILYCTLLRLQTDLNQVLLTVNGMRHDSAVKHALEVLSAVNTNNYCLFFRLYAAAPNKGRFLMRRIADDVVRPVAVRALLVAHRPKPSAAQLAEWLRCENEAQAEALLQQQ
eukprot:TRINITY_DN18027_c0_g1_i1.p1 TRINITY_DN18027_c0_g1~~TRINITY_DN18027_c0_g1_i1.p1  ORF type:complete len:346 (+),score=118.93 TRINITY_DN18027_c0_g1_i1:23-1060(+)